MSQNRRYARAQNLPQAETNILRDIQSHARIAAEFHLLYNRALELYQLGWPLRAIGEAFDPPIHRTTIHGWVSLALTNPHSTPNHGFPPATAPPLTTQPLPIPRVLSLDETHKLSDLQYAARRYRNAMSYDHPAARSSRELTDLCKNLYSAGISIKDIADAAGVSYQSISKRVKSDTI
jgi:hypothetical protein